MNSPARPRVIVHVSIAKVPPVTPVEADACDDAGPTCGWYESSWALREGLAVRELAPAELPDDGSVAALWLAAQTRPAAASARWQ